MELGVALCAGGSASVQGLISAMTVGENIGMTRLGAPKRPFIDFNAEKHGAGVYRQCESDASCAPSGA